jgi:hypothetical protein
MEKELSRLAVAEVAEVAENAPTLGISIKVSSSFFSSL